MAQIAKGTLYSYVVTFWKPKVQQVKDWMDSYWHKEELIPISSIDGLQTLLNSLPSQNSINTLLTQLLPTVLTLSANGSFTVPAGKIIDLIRVESALTQAVSISDSGSGEDLLGEIDVTAGVVRSVGCNIAAGVANRTINITGVTSSVTLKFYIR